MTMASSYQRPRVAVFGPDPLLNVTIEARGAAAELHFHAGGQGPWVTTMVAELGAWPVLCCLMGGETGTMLLPLLQALPGERRIVATVHSNGSCVFDHREREPELVAASLRQAPRHHEIDDLVAATCAAALHSDLMVVCNPYPADGFPDEVYDTLVADVRAAGVPVVVDLSSPRLDRTLPHGPDLVKLNDWELAEYVQAPVDGPRALIAARALQDAGARTVAVTRADAPILVVPAEGQPYEIVPPSFPRGFRAGCGDSMTGAVAAGLARGMSMRDALVLGAAAGSGNFLRHGLGTGRRPAIEELSGLVAVRALSEQVAAR
ncbi:MAG: PfkB family carbohydrate kinase [Solirubrobacteraceae bacterium]